MSPTASCVSRGWSRCLRRCAVAGTAALLLTFTGFSQSRGASEEAGRTSAVLSFIDATAGRVEIVRHWPEAPSDVMIYPFVPYFWDACPGGVLVRAADWYTPTSTFFNVTCGDPFLYLTLTCVLRWGGKRMVRHVQNAIPGTGRSSRPRLDL